MTVSTSSEEATMSNSISMTVSNSGIDTVGLDEAGCLEIYLDTGEMIKSETVADGVCVMQAFGESPLGICVFDDAKEMWADVMALV